MLISALPNHHAGSCFLIGEGQEDSPFHTIGRRRVGTSDLLKVREYFDQFQNDIRKVAVECIFALAFVNLKDADEREVWSENRLASSDHLCGKAAEDSRFFELLNSLGILSCRLS